MSFLRQTSPSARHGKKADAKNPTPGARQNVGRDETVTKTDNPQNAARKAIPSSASRTSAQVRQLKSSLVRRSIIYWVVYTIVFIFVAWFCNSTIIPGMANEIANSTSYWQEYTFEDESLSTALRNADAQLMGIIATEPEKTSEDENVDTSESADNASSASSGDAKDKAAYTEQDAWLDNWLTFFSDDSEALVTSDGAIFAVNPSAGLSLDYIEKFAPNLDSALLFIKHDDEYDWVSFAQLKQEGAERTFPQVFSGNTENLQVLFNDNVMSVRDLTFYNQVKSLKLPIAIAIYMLGCIIVLYAVFRRSLRYFNDLSSAVGDLISNKEKPIELPAELAITQNELNSIRLSSLADERAAVAAERRKDELVAYLAHDIKTPLTSVIGYLMLLDESPDLPENARTRYVHIACEKSQRLEAMVDEFFEITRYNLQSIPLERQHLDIRLFLEQVAEEFAPSAASANLQVNVIAQPRQIYADGDKLARAVGNVLRNAIAYADTGTVVKLQAQVVNDQMCISVEDQGREISEAHLASIFEKFYREDSARTSSSGNAGLGLAIAREIVLAHGGTIAAASEGGITTFTICIPA